MLSKSIASKIPKLKEKLRVAAVNKTPEIYIKECLKNGFVLSFLVSILFLFLVLKLGLNAVLVFIFFIIMYAILFTVFLMRVDVLISKREKEIDRDVLFAGRFLLVKLNSGKPLINSIMDASNGYGVAGKYFKEIVDDIELGTVMEEALDNAYKHTPSRRFKKILFQINNSLKIGVDVSVPLEATLEEISQEQLVEIQKYGKKLNSITMFYMLAAIVVPSLGITLFSVIASMISITVDIQMFFVVLFFLIVIQLIFLSIFKSIRPNLNL